MSAMYARKFVALVAITIAITAAVVILHELGHFAIATSEGCQAKITLLDADMQTYTTVACRPTQAIELGGLLFTVPFGVLLLAFGRKYSMIALGFNLAVSWSDFALISTSAAYALAAAGLLMIIFGENMIVNSLIPIDAPRAAEIASSD